MNGTCSKCGKKIDTIIIDMAGLPIFDKCMDCYKEIKGITWKKPKKKSGKKPR